MSWMERKRKQRIILVIELQRKVTTLQYEKANWPLMSKKIFMVIHIKLAYNQVQSLVVYFSEI